MGVGGLLLGVLLVRLVGVALGRVGWERLVCCVAPCILPWHGRLLVRHRLQITRIRFMFFKIVISQSYLYIASLRCVVHPWIGCLVGRLLRRGRRSSTVALLLDLLHRGNGAHQWLGWTSAASRGVTTGVRSEYWGLISPEWDQGGLHCRCWRR